MSTYTSREVPTVEDARMAAVRRYDVLDTPPDGAFDRVTELAAAIFEVPISVVSIVDVDRIWFKSRHGLDAEQVGRDPGLCSSAILQDETWIVTDAARDPRTLTNPLVVGDLGLRFYAGHPLCTQDGHRLGTLAVIDRQPRSVSPRESAALRSLSQVVVDELELRISARRLLTLERERAERTRQEAVRYQRMAETLQQGLASNRQIGKALGLVMSQYRLSDEAALQKLKRQSQDLNMKLNALAEEIVTHYNTIC